jgi:hypothetical protein
MGVVPDFLKSRNDLIFRIKRDKSHRIFFVENPYSEYEGNTSIRKVGNYSGNDRAS